MNLSEDDIRHLCAVLNQHGDDGPEATPESLPHFGVAYVRTCILRAMLHQSERHPAPGIWLTLDRARELLGDAHRNGATYMEDLPVEQINITLTIPFSLHARRVIAAYARTMEEDRSEDPVLASECGPATRTELEAFVSEVVDQKLEWLDEDHDDLSRPIRRRGE